MRQKSYLFAVFLLLACVHAQAAPIISSDRTYIEAWSKAGYPGEIPAPAKIVNVKDFGALGNGIANDQPAVVAAMTALSNAPGVVYFPAGQYVIPTVTKPVSGVVFRGERAENTSLVISNDPIFYPFWVLGKTNSQLQAVISGYTNHSSTITVTDGSIFAAGDYAEIVEAHDPAMNIPVSGWAESLGQILRIASVTGSNLTLVYPIRMDFQAGLSPSIRKFTPVKDVGFENLAFRRVITTSTGTLNWNNRFDIDFTYAANCWVRGITSTNCLGAAIAVERSTQIEVTGCYIHEPWVVGGGGEGYGIKLQFHPGECKFENNIFRGMRHSMALQAGANSAVFGYNYSRDPAGGNGDVQVHGSGTYANLFEGNIVGEIDADTNSGNNGPLSTFFRNRTEGSGFGLSGDSGYTNQNVVGNEVGGSGFYLVPAGFAYGNNTTTGVQPAGATTIADYSYYLTNDPTILPALPVWWNIPSAFPSIGLPLSRTTIKTNPAYARWNSGAISLAVGPPSLAKQPTNLTVAAGSTAAFSVQATGTPVAVFAWYKDGIALPTQTNATCTIVNAQPSDAGNYDVLITDGNPFSVRSAPASLVVSGGIACTFGLSSSSTNFPPNGGTLSFGVTASASSCTWTSFADVVWITSLFPTSTNGNATVAGSIPFNPNSTSRTGHVFAAGQTYTVIQLGATSTFNDGIPDWWRQTYFGTAGSTNSQSCATCDVTRTGQDNLFKYVTGLNPTNPASVFNFNAARGAGQMNLTYGPIAAGRTYTPVFDTSMTGNVWNVLTPISGPVTNGNQITVTDLNATGQKKFYEINISVP